MRNKMAKAHGTDYYTCVSSGRGWEIGLRTST